MIKHTAENYNPLEQLRSEFLPTPYVSTIVRGCAEKALDMPSGGPELRFITIEGVGYATNVDSLLAIKKFVYNDKKYTIAQIKEALLNDYKGNKDQTIMRTIFQMKAPK